MGKKIRVSSIGAKESEYETKYDWGFFCQSGTGGIVFSASGNYTTAFFEAFPRQPSCFIRGEGATVEEAEQQAWEQWQKIQGCEHEMERRNRKDGYGYCKHCSYSAMVFEPLTKCCKCGEPTNYTYDTKKQWYCKKHSRNMPKRLQSYWMLDRHKRLPRVTKKEMKKGAAIKLTGGKYGKIMFEYKVGIAFKANGYRLDVFNSKQRRLLIQMGKK